ncbi:hypothetical protein [Streptomyces sp. NPDC001933]|uniref:hypothetical protein n=1 Tax=Streptomyces sp. NPDC001933 TaxID=3364626 RepID=UPI0036C1F1BF
MTYDSLVNHGDYLSAHYLAEVLPKDLKAKDGLLARWAAFEEEERRRHADAVAEAKRQGLDPASVPPRARTPREGLRALRGPYFAGRAALAEDAEALAEPDAPEPEGWRKRYTEVHLDTLHALGYTAAHEQTVTVHRADHAYTVQVAHAEPGLYAVSCGWTTEPDAALDPDGAGRLLHPVALETSATPLEDAKAVTDFLFACDTPPRYVLLLVGGVIVLADRLAWHEGRYLAADLDAALNRRDDRHGGELDTVAALFGADSLRVPTEGGTAPLAAFLDKSGKHAVGVSTELREGLRLSVEWIAGEVLDRLREPENGITPAELDDPARLAKELSREALRYLYRILFLLYAEAGPALGILPSDYPEYERGYGLQRLGDLVLRDLVGERSRRGFHLYESLDLLFDKVENGHRRYGTEPEDLTAEAAVREAARAEQEADGLLAAGTITRAEHTERVREADRARRAAARSTSAGLRFEALRSELFTKEAVRLISDDQIENPAYRGGEGERRRPFLDTRLRNETLHKVLRRLMLTQGKGRERGGFISYAQLGINQLGAVYEGLMSYTGFIAEEELYEVAKGGDPSGGSWMIPASRVQDYRDEVFVQRTNAETGRPERVVHPKDTFVYRLAGRDRQTSATRLPRDQPYHRARRARRPRPAAELQPDRLGHRTGGHPHLDGEAGRRHPQGPQQDPPPQSPRAPRPLRVRPRQPLLRPGLQAPCHRTGHRQSRPPGLDLVARLPRLRARPHPPCRAGPLALPPLPVRGHRRRRLPAQGPGAAPRHLPGRTRRRPRPRRQRRTGEAALHRRARRRHRRERRRTGVEARTRHLRLGVHPPGTHSPHQHRSHPGGRRHRHGLRRAGGPPQSLLGLRRVRLRRPRRRPRRPGHR